MAPAYLRALSRQFSISAPRMAVRTHLAWPWKVALAIVLVATIAGMWWLGFDLGQLGGISRNEREQLLATLTADAAIAQRDVLELRAQNMQLESDLAMMRGLQATLHKQQAEAQQETAQLKDELAFLRQFFSDSTKAPGVGIQRIAVDGNGSEVVRYSVLIIRGGSTQAEFDGQLALQAELVPARAGDASPKPMTVSLPGDAPETAAPLKLKFKYYQRVEGTMRLPPGYLVRTLTARAYESGAPAPRATRTLTMP